MAKYKAVITFTATSDSDAEDAIREAVIALQDYVETDAVVDMTHVISEYSLDADGNELSSDEDDDDE